jgi:hypothetical protein
MRLVLASSILFVTFAFACSKDDETNGRPACGPEPIAECSAACDTACAALSACGQATSACLSQCRSSLVCGGESESHDRAICNGLSDRLRGATCEAACSEAKSFALDPGGCSAPTSDAGADAAETGPDGS